MILFQDGDWRLVGPVGTKSHIMHKCGPGYKLHNQDPDRNGWWDYTHDRICVVCKTHVPDEMIGLQTLTNWER